MAWNWQREQDLPLRFLALAAKDMEASYQSTSLQKKENNILFCIPSTGKKNSKFQRERQKVN